MVDKIVNKLNNIPNVLVAGVPKSGTTSLYKYLKEHPDIFLPDTKELHFFSSSEIKKSEWTRR